MSTGGQHYLPRPDADFGAWADHFGPALYAWWEAQHLDVNDLQKLLDAIEALDDVQEVYSSAVMDEAE